ncbi:MAG: membrane protein insertase YidC [Rickettsiales bacterium]|nr:membrane protein insertase YidC [Rickettsiales bacterium]
MENNHKNILMATILSAVVLIGWAWFFEKPRIEKQEKLRKEYLQSQKVEGDVEKVVAKSSATKKIENLSVEKAISFKDRKELISGNNRVKISSHSLHGSILLKGARFDDLTLAKYFKTIKKEEEVVLFSPTDSKDRYFADFGWVSSDKNLELPGPNTMWKADKKNLTPDSEVTLSWKNRQGVEFVLIISMDDDYMFSVDQEIVNHSKKEISAAVYGRINRNLAQKKKSIYILHEGAIGEFDEVLNEVTYDELIDDAKVEFHEKKGGWFGITDKYWLSSLLPDKKLQYNASFDFKYNNQTKLFNTEFIAQEYKIAPKEKLQFNHHLFAGAKKVKLLDKYSKDYGVKHFDKAVDFGWFYFLTKPFFYMISFLNDLIGNFGLAILAMTVLVKAALFPMANKSYKAIARIKQLQPQIETLKKKHGSDKLAFNKDMMALYKTEKVNPASGCLPIIFQIPIFFSLYKVLFVTLDMRHASFYGWINDLSAPDPTTIFNLFGILPFDLGPAMTIGVWPILMGITMFIQQKLSPASSDPVQTKVLKWMPVVLVFVLSGFPAGLVIYWTWSNTLSILQQYVIVRKYR